MGGVRRIAGNLSSYKSQQKNWLQCSLELVFSYSFISIALSLSLITSNKGPLDLSFAIMIVEKLSLYKLMVELSHLIPWAKHIKTKHMCDWVHIPWEGCWFAYGDFKIKTWNCISISMAISHTTLQGWFKDYC